MRRLRGSSPSTRSTGSARSVACSATRSTCPCAIARTEANPQPLDLHFRPIVQRVQCVQRRCRRADGEGPEGGRVRPPEDPPRCEARCVRCDGRRRRCRRHPLRGTRAARRRPHARPRSPLRDHRSHRRVRRSARARRRVGVGDVRPEPDRSARRVADTRPRGGDAQGRRADCPHRGPLPALGGPGRARDDEGLGGDAGTCRRTSSHNGSRARRS